jgi:hypothetical protein
VRSRSSSEAIAVTNLPLLPIISNLWKWNNTTDEIEAEVLLLTMNPRKTIAYVVKDGPPQKRVTHIIIKVDQSESKIQ